MTSICHHNVPNPAQPIRRFVRILASTATDTHNFHYTEDGTLSIDVDETALVEMAAVPDYVVQSAAIPGYVALNSDGISALRHLLAEIDDAPVRKPAKVPAYQIGPYTVESSDELVTLANEFDAVSLTHDEAYKLLLVLQELFK
jgi:hypothetical protein